MTRRPLVGTGWKMNLLAADVAPYAERLLQHLSAIDHDGVDIFVLPAFTSLHAARTAFADSAIRLGAQNMHWEAAGAWTGEISAAMLIEAGCRYVELAHSERLACFAETYELVRRKVDAALSAGLIPILCIGESGQQAKAGEADIALEDQLRTVLDGRPGSEVAAIVIAYEPRWAIGGAEAASPAYVAARHQAIRRMIAREHGAAASAACRILYGGSVTPRNGRALIALEDVDGLFIGRAAWNADGFAEMIRIVTETAGS